MNNTLRTCYIGMGGNTGDRLANLRAALRQLSGLGTLVAVSPLYETPPWGYADQPWFYNAVCVLKTALPLEQLLHELKQIEARLGRRPGIRWGPRPVDLDILLCDSLVVATPNLEVPHPGLSQRGFVLRPLADLAPDLRHPTDGRTVTEMLRDLEATGEASG
ncbi:MAG: 2-amino-4-hydroxy-6-hydroxymethyldihydropteridine diphosphokinase, partial [Chloroflexota bacterium]